MRRGTTPECSYELPFDTSFVSKARMFFSQNDKKVFKREDCTLEGNIVKVVLTQEETLLLNHDLNVQIQLQVLTTGGGSLLTDITVEDVGKFLGDDVLQ